MLKVSNVIKTYKNAKEPALKGISFDVKKGEICTEDIFLQL